MQGCGGGAHEEGGGGLQAPGAPRQVVLPAQVPSTHLPPALRCRNQVYTPAGEVGEGEEEAGGLVEALEGEQFVQEEHTS